jgi:hypothetical protein
MTPDTQQKASSRAVTTLVLGILSITCTGFLTGIPAIILGLTELKAIKAGEAPREGESMTKVGMILGLVSTILTALAVLVGILVVAFGISLGASGVFDQLSKTSI